MAAGRSAGRPSTRRRRSTDARQRSATSRRASGSPTNAAVGRRARPGARPSATRAVVVVGADAVGCADRRARDHDDRDAAPRPASTTSSPTVRPRTTIPSTRPATSTASSARRRPWVDRMSTRAVELGGDLLVAEDDLGVVRAGEVGEDDAVGGVPALGERRPSRLGMKSRSSARPPRPARGWQVERSGRAPASHARPMAMLTPRPRGRRRGWWCAWTCLSVTVFL